MIAYDREESTEMKPKYFVYDTDNTVIYKGTYTQCLVVEGAISINPDITLKEIKDKTEDFV